MDLSRPTEIELLRLQADILEELRTRRIITTANAPLGDYAEWLFRGVFDWKTAGNSNKDVDAIGADGTRYQIKARRLQVRNKSRQLGALRRLPDANFDFLAAVLFNEDFTVSRAAIIPHSRVLDNASYVQATNAWKFHLRDEVWSWNDVKDVTSVLRAAQ